MYQLSLLYCLQYLQFSFFWGAHLLLDVFSRLPRGRRQPGSRNNVHVIDAPVPLTSQPFPNECPARAMCDIGVIPVAVRCFLGATHFLPIG